MEINTNVTSAVAASISKLNLNTAKRSFEAQKTKKEDNVEELIEDKKEAISLNNESRPPVDVEDIQKYAK